MNNIISRQFIVFEVKLFGGMEESEVKFKSLLNPVSLKACTIVFKLMCPQPYNSFFKVRALCMMWILRVGTRKCYMVKSV